MLSPLDQQAIYACSIYLVHEENENKSKISISISFFSSTALHEIAKRQFTHSNTKKQMGISGCYGNCWGLRGLCSPSQQQVGGLFFGHSILRWWLRT